MKASDEFLAEPSNHGRTSSHDPSGSDPESGPGGSEGDPLESHAEEAERHATSGSSNSLTQILLRFVEEVIGSADGLIQVYADRLRLSVRRTIVQVAVGAGVAICTAVWLGAAALAILRGVCGGLTAVWGGREWLGNLTGGLLACAFTASAVALYLRVSSRRELGRLRAKYERIRNEHGENPRTASPAGDGGGVA